VPAEQQGPRDADPDPAEECWRQVFLLDRFFQRQVGGAPADVDQGERQRQGPGRGAAFRSSGGNGTHARQGSDTGGSVPVGAILHEVPPLTSWRVTTAAANQGANFGDCVAGALWAIAAGDGFVVD